VKRPLALLGLTLVALVLSVLLHACMPVSQRLAAPVVCPSETTESLVVAYSTSSGSGKTSSHSHLYCIDADGGGYQPAFTKTVAVQFAYTSTLVFGLFFGIRAVRRIKSKKVQS